MLPYVVVVRAVVSLVSLVWCRYVVFQVFYNVSLQASNIAAMIISAQVVDNFITRAAGHSYALDYEHFQ